jgi:hypothetical protein
MMEEFDMEVMQVVGYAQDVAERRGDGDVGIPRLC